MIYIPIVYLSRRKYLLQLYLEGVVWKILIFFPVILVIIFG